MAKVRALRASFAPDIKLEYLSRLMDTLMDSLESRTTVRTIRLPSFDKGRQDNAEGSASLRETAVLWKLARVKSA